MPFNLNQKDVGSRPTTAKNNTAQQTAAKPTQVVKSAQTTQPPQTTYTFNGQTYNTSDEANAARDQYIADRKNKALMLYVDAASVGFDQDKFGALVQSGAGLSQMTDAERDFITSRYQASNPYDRKAYTDSTVDQYLASAGMPAYKELNSYRKSYYDYVSGGGVLDNYFLYRCCSCFCSYSIFHVNSDGGFVCLRLAGSAKKKCRKAPCFAPGAARISGRIRRSAATGGARSRRRPTAHTRPCSRRTLRISGRPGRSGGSPGRRTRRTSWRA